MECNVEIGVKTAVIKVFVSCLAHHQSGQSRDSVRVGAKSCSPVMTAGIWMYVYIIIIYL